MTKKGGSYWNLPFFLGDLAGARTQDPHIKSVMLYLLSYQVDLLRFAAAKVQNFFHSARK